MISATLSRDRGSRLDVRDRGDEQVRLDGSPLLAVPPPVSRDVSRLVQQRNLASSTPSQED